MGERSTDHPLRCHPDLDLLTSSSDGPQLPAPPPQESVRSRRREWLTTVAGVALQAAWSSRHPGESFAKRPLPPPDRLYYRAQDGWESPLWFYPALPGAAAEPLVLAHGLGLRPSGFGVGDEQSLVHAARAAGYAVYLLAHRGDPGSIAPRRNASFDFDDIAALDVPAALERILAHSGDSRVLWLGHAMGGQLLYAHLALHGATHIAAGVSLCAPVRFSTPKSQARLLSAASRMLPASWPLPTRTLHQALAPLTGENVWSPLGVDMQGASARGLMLHGTNDVHSGMLRQFAKWLESGSLCDRHDRLDYVAGMQRTEVPILVVAAEGDNLCPPSAARPAYDALRPERASWLKLDAQWGHLDPLIGKRAPGALHPELFRWLGRWRHRCDENQAAAFG